jgi:hypothetical protein
MTNDEMTPNRFGRWAYARQTHARIMDTFAKGGIVILCSYTKPIQYDARYVHLFEVRKSGLYVKQGKRWVCTSNVTWKFGLPVGNYRGLSRRQP